jgi:two-component system CheB/CheR fusion protein
MVSHDNIGPYQRPSFVVGIGASAGGLEALERLFKAMPADTGMAFVVIQHLSPDFKSLMDELLARFTRMTVLKVVEPTTVAANSIYLLPPGKEMLIDGDRLDLVERLSDTPIHLPISRFFRSLAAAWGDHAIAIVLSGTGSDGSSGVRDIHAAGGLALAQTERTARFDGMPRAAIGTGFVHRVLAPEEIPEYLVAHARGSADDLIDASVAVPEVSSLTALLDRLRDVLDIDFSVYKPGTLNRRIRRRMEFAACPSVEDYCRRTLTNPAELAQLGRDLLIGVTRFFRDPLAFEVLRDQVIPEIVAAVPPSDDIRVWVAGCATGEEAYSLAILFLRELEHRERPPNLRVFATDVHRESLRIASDGTYPAEALDGVPAELRSEYFVAEPDGRFVVHPRVRKRVLFSPHNLLKDVPFNRIDLVSCRNVLIYFQPGAQARALASFYFALRLHGHLFLGPSESIGDLEGRFATTDRTWKLYRKDSDTRLTVDAPVGGAPLPMAPPPRPRLGTDSRLTRIYDVLLARHVPTGVLIDERREQQYVFGDVSRFLRPPPGRPTLDVVAMAEGEVRIALTTAIATAIRRRSRIEARAVATGLTSPATVDLIVEPLEDPTGGAPYYLVSFVEPTLGAVADAPRPFEVADDIALRLRQLELEAQESRESFHAMLEEVEATNEELQASNEELIASNEELQSTNEELQSVNEELHSVNSEYNQKIRELADAEADLRNLIANTVDGVLFVDRGLSIRMFTAGASAVLNLLPHDQGRPLAHITSRVPDDDLHAVIEQVSQRPAPVETVLHLADGRHFLRRVQPYRSGDSERDGYVIVFQDVTERETVRRLEHDQLDLLQTMIGASRSHVAVLDRDGRIVATNAGWDRFWVDNGGADHHRWVGSDYLATLRRDPDAAAALQALTDVLSGRSPSADLDYPCHTATQERWFWMNVTALPAPRGGALVTHTDITSRHQQATLAQGLQEAARLESLGLLAGGIAHDFNNILTGVLMNLSAVKPAVTTDPVAASALADIGDAASRAAELCRQMLAYAGRARLLTQRTRLDALIRECQALLRASLRSAHLELELGLDLPEVEVDVASIQQVLMNLVLNAVESLPDGRGTVWVSTGLAAARPEPGEHEVVAPATSELGHVQLLVEDNGCGMPPEILRRIFEPFFTTKFTGRGLGLAGAQGIVRAHRGGLYVSSTVGEGTRFRVLLPSAAAASAPPPRAVDTRPPPREVAHATVLVIDDEELMRRSLARILALRGHQADTAENGERGVELVRAAPDRYRLVILDLTMPGMDGVETMAMIRAIAPNLPIVIASGYAEAGVAERFASHRPDAFLQKPIDAATLTRVLARMLPAPPTAAT